MKIIYMVVGLVMVQVNVIAQGVKFEKEITWTDLKVKAMSENKYIFIDCYATWWGHINGWTKKFIQITSLAKQLMIASFPLS